MHSLSLALALALASGQHAPFIGQACTGTAQTQSALNACAASDAQRAEARRDHAYRTLLTRAARQPDAVTKITVAERAWTAYRDAYVEAAFPLKDKQTEYGSIYPMEVDETVVLLTNQHVDALEALIDRYTPH